jgi:hypothetical protein
LPRITAPASRNCFNDERILLRRRSINESETAGGGLHLIGRIDVSFMTMGMPCSGLSAFIAALRDRASVQSPTRPVKLDQSNLSSYLTSDACKITGCGSQPMSSFRFQANSAIRPLTSQKDREHGRWPKHFRLRKPHCNRSRNAQKLTPFDFHILAPGSPSASSLVYR